MSMNLHCNVLDYLWQTPTEVTYMCMTDSDGLHYELEGEKALGAINRYIEWVRQSTNGVWDSMEAMEAAKQSANWHIEEVKNAIKSSEETLRVFVL